MTTSTETSLQKFEEVAGRCMAELGFDPLGRLAERHGGWQIVFHAASGGDPVDRTVVAALTPVAPGDPCRYEIEVWAGCQTGNRFTRFPGATMEVAGAEFDAVEFLQTMRSALGSAVELANSVRLDRAS